MFARLALVAVTLWGALSSCRSGGGRPMAEGGVGGADGTTTVRSELLGAFGTCAATGARDFRTQVSALQVAVAGLVSTPGEPSRTAAREAFRRAMDSWQFMEVMQFGPTAPLTVPGGQDFRDNIYAWPLFGRCAVEEALVAGTYQSSNFGTVLLANRRGLAAIEYLLFYEGADTACTAGSPALAGWMALSADERDARKRAYALAASDDVLRRAIALDEAWDPAGKNFVQTLRSAGPGNATYATAQEAIQTVGIALFYMDTVVKGQKLEVALQSGCTTASCLESAYAGRSKANIRANLISLRRVLEGCQDGYTGIGFIDLLVAIGVPEQADTLRTATIAAQAALDAIEEPDLDQALVQDPASVAALRSAIAAVATILKTDFVTLLGFEPAIIPTDNDS